MVPIRGLAAPKEPPQSESGNILPKRTADDGGGGPPSSFHPKRGVRQDGKIDKTPNNRLKGTPCLL